jgi:hypothetical protein
MDAEAGDLGQFLEDGIDLRGGGKAALILRENRQRDEQENQSKAANESVETQNPSGN